MELEKLYLSPRFQNRGIGSHIVKQLLVTAASTGKPVRLRVLKVNESAQRFYRRHGSVVTSVSLERIFMEVPAGGKANWLRSNISRRWLARNSPHDELFKNIAAKAE